MRKDQGHRNDAASRLGLVIAAASTWSASLTVWLSLPWKRRLAASKRGKSILWRARRRTSVNIGIVDRSLGSARLWKPVEPRALGQPFQGQPVRCSQVVQTKVRPFGAQVSTTGA